VRTFLCEVGVLCRDRHDAHSRLAGPRFTKRGHFAAARMMLPKMQSAILARASSDWKATGMRAISSIVRPASAQDAAACVAIYRPYVESTVISWEIEVPSVEEMASRIASAQKAHEWLVLEHNDQVIGFAYGHALNRLPSYKWSAETGIYVSCDHHRAGAGRQLYTQVLRRLTERGYRRAFAGITQPNEASNSFHRSFGFQDIGLYRRVEWKHNSWHDVAWMQLDLLGPADPDEPPGPII
jgi:phosphinothricin acetyltransferase